MDGRRFETEGVQLVLEVGQDRLAQDVGDFRDGLDALVFTARLARGVLCRLSSPPVRCDVDEDGPHGPHQAAGSDAHGLRDHPERALAVAAEAQFALGGALAQDGREAPKGVP
ncbi:hypothetical protein AMK17_26610 [Streptomyces sp. CB00072]|uniref:hypothetical protein n=1 Tax=Streptomyces sp. CB00072 TaxID=1703928 RepID=UPI00093C3A37|nr:hypothetical protein [Streptomyces sp. CB00072]OKI53242.1 hypothetical protein AMK17_26610 [Streptomyces sp. CB00072]